MFKITSIRITGFWQSFEAAATFREDVNIIIGKNGSGKTTFMNIVHAVLAVDVDALYENSFKSVALTLSDGKRNRTIRAERKEPPSTGFPVVEYHISNRKYFVFLAGTDDGRGMHLSARRRAMEQAQEIKQELNELVSVSSLSVYRMGGETDQETRERTPRRYASTVDARLFSLMQRLTQYQLELSNSAREISTLLQRDVLTSLLYSEGKRVHSYQLDFDEATERQNLIATYRQLGVGGGEVTRRIQEHISAVGTAVKNLKKARSENNPALKIDFAALEAFKLTSTVVAKSLEAEKKTKDLFSQIDLFLMTLKKFISDKNFAFTGGELVISTDNPIPLTKLSSGEKQLLILFIEALLQRRKPYIFLADEPELSLHISWQREILPAIRSLNPNAQMVVATHSPEIAGKFRDCLLDMAGILRG